MVRVSGYRYTGPGFDPRRYQIFWVVMVLELRSYLNEKSSGSRSRKQRLTAVGTRYADHVTPLSPQKLALTSPTGSGRSVGIVRVRTKATELLINFNLLINDCNHTTTVKADGGFQMRLQGTDASCWNNSVNAHNIEEAYVIRNLYNLITYQIVMFNSVTHWRSLSLNR